MTESRSHTKMRARWSAIGAAVAVTIGAGGLGVAQAAVSTGDRPVTVTVAAERILDTRVDLGLPGKFTDSSPRDLQVTGLVDVASGGQQTVVPADAVAVLVNVTVIRPTRPGFLSLRPGGAAGAPTTSTVNFTDGSIEPNSATVDLNDGQIQIWLSDAISDAASADVAIDVVGYTIGHDHDDRYYTKAEVDALKPLVAAIGTDGSPTGIHDAFGLVSSERISVGTYRLTFDRDVRRCIGVGSDATTLTRDVSVTTLAYGADQVGVLVADQANTPVDTTFNVILQCLPT